MHVSNRNITVIIFQSNRTQRQEANLSPSVYPPMLINASDGDPVTTSTALHPQKEREALFPIDAYERCVSTNAARVWDAALALRSLRTSPTRDKFF